MSNYLDDPLYRELIPIRISHPSGCDLGPTAQFRLLEVARELWDTIHAVTQDDGTDLPLSA